MTSTPVYTSTAEGFRDAKEIAGLRPMAAPRPRAPRKAAEKRAVSSGIVCFCGERFAESQALEFMLHLRAEVGEVLEWRERSLERQRARQHKHRVGHREQLNAKARDYRQTPQGREAERRRDERRERPPEQLEKRRRQQATPEYREKRNARDRARRAEREAVTG